MIQYPCILKLFGDDELIYLSSQSALSNESDTLIWHKEDCLIDGTGQKYLFKEDDTEARNFIKVGTLLSTYEITKLIQAHEFSKAQVC